MISGIRPLGHILKHVIPVIGFAEHSTGFLLAIRQQLHSNAIGAGFVFVLVIHPHLGDGNEQFVIGVLYGKAAIGIAGHLRGVAVHSAFLQGILNFNFRIVFIAVYGQIVKFAMPVIVPGQLQRILFHVIGKQSDADRSGTPVFPVTDPFLVNGNGDEAGVGNGIAIIYPGGFKAFFDGHGINGFIQLITVRRSFFFYIIGGVGHKLFAGHGGFALIIRSQGGHFPGAGFILIHAKHNARHGAVILAVLLAQGNGARGFVIGVHKFRQLPFVQGLALSVQISSRRNDLIFAFFHLHGDLSNELFLIVIDGPVIAGFFTDIIGNILVHIVCGEFDGIKFDGAIGLVGYCLQHLFLAVTVQGIQFERELAFLHGGSILQDLSCFQSQVTGFGFDVIIGEDRI